jgi:hypothetical protein
VQLIVNRKRLEKRRRSDIARCCARRRSVHIKWPHRVDSVCSNAGNTLRNSFVRRDFACFQFKNNPHGDSQNKITSE